MTDDRITGKTANNFHFINFTKKMKFKSQEKKQEYIQYYKYI